MPSRPQKSAKKDAERYSMFRSNHILVTLRWKDGLFPCNENVCLLLDVSWKMFEMVFKLSKLVNLKACLSLGVSEPRKRLLRVQHTLCVTDKVNRHLSKKTKKNIRVKEI